MFVYLNSEPGLWTVGFYKPFGKWEAESDHDSPEKAADRCALLNGSPIAELATLRALITHDRQQVLALTAGLKYISEHDYRGTGMTLGGVIEDMRAQASASLTIAGIVKGE